MTTLHEMIYHVKNTMRGGLGNDNDPVTLKQIGRWIDQARADVLLRSWAQYRYDHTLLEQDPGVLKPSPQTAKRYIINGGDQAIEDKDLNSYNTDYPFYRNMWTIEIPELIGIPGHEDLKIGTALNDIFTVPVIEHSQQNWMRYLKFSGNNSRYCWNTGRVKMIPHLNKINIEVPSIQDTTLGVKKAGEDSYIKAANPINQSVLTDLDENGATLEVFQPFFRIHGIFARPLEVEGWVSDDPASLIKTAKTLRYPITEALKEQVIIHIRENYMNAIHTYFNDRANNDLQEKDRLDTSDDRRKTSGGSTRMPRARR